MNLQENIMNRVVRTVVLTMLSAALFFSCGKDSDDPSTAGDGTLQYKVNGDLVVIHNNPSSNSESVVFTKYPKGPIIPISKYMLNAEKGNDNTCIIGVLTDSLQTQTYTLDSLIISQQGFGCSVEYKGMWSNIDFAGDTMTLNITSYNNGLIGGTFTAKLSPADALHNPSLKGTTLITEGEFKNIPCIY